MSVEYLEQLHQRQRRSRSAVLVAGECIHAAAEDLGGLLLVQALFFLTLAMNAGSTMAAFTCLLNSSIAALVRADSAMSSTASPQAGQ